MYICSKAFHFLGTQLSTYSSFIELLKNTTDKYTASDIDARLKSFDVDLVKEICEQLYHDGTINRTGNYRYYIFSENITPQNGITLYLIYLFFLILS